MNCYLCLTLDDLSIKRRSKTGKCLYICKACRREKYHERKELKQFKSAPAIEYKSYDQWQQLAIKHNTRILTRP